MVGKYVPTEARILDAGVGTGLVGQCLWELGFRKLVAIDLSQGMLDEARKKGVYQELQQMVLGEELDFPTGSMSAVVSAGVMTVGHAPASSLDELVRVTELGGHIVFTLRPDVYVESGFREKQNSLMEAGKWELIEATEPFQALPKGEPDVYHQVWVYQVR
jgi:SAM-dependent methyltransferase